MLSSRRRKGVDPPDTASKSLLSSNPALVLGFASVLLMLVVVAGLSLARLDRFHQQLELIVDDHRVKETLIGRMRTAAREGILTLQKMLLLEDPFERDAQWLRLVEQAAIFTEARRALLAQPLSDEERHLLELPGASAAALPLQEQVADLIMVQELDEARRLLVGKAIPAQDRLLAELDRLRALRDARTHESTEHMLRAYAATRSTVIATTLAALLMGIGVALLVIRRARTTQALLQAQRERALVTLYSIGEGVITTDTRARIEHMNAAAERLLGVTLAEARGRPFLRVARIYHEHNRHPATDLLVRALSGNQSVRSTDELILITDHAGERAIELTSTPIHGPHQLMGAVHVLRDVTEMRALSRELAYHAAHDGLTGLMNRREFERRLQQALEASRTEQSEHALCYIELDMFKVVNDTCGHLAGDELLRQLGQLLRDHTRTNDVLARLGGDEFGLLLWNCPVGTAEYMAEQVQSALRAFRFVWDDKSFDVSASIGVVGVTADSGGVDDLLRAADLACYAAKEAGRGRLHVFRPDDDAMLRREGEMHWVPRLKRALDEDRLTLYHQPIEALDPRIQPQRLYEVLVRMRQRDGGIVAAASFLPIAERYQLSPLIDRWVVGRMLDVLAEPAAQAEGPACLYTINLSGQSLCDDAFLRFVLQRLEDSGVAGERLCFEITETAAVANLTRARRFIAALKAHGCRFALDDFGSGLSSFSYLKNLPVDFLKIDGAFVRDIQGDATDLTLVESINQIGHAMGMRTIAEFVQDERTREILTELGVDYVQGNAIAAPSPLSDLLPSASRADSPPRCDTA